jgi:hypothetical protein
VTIHARVAPSSLDLTIPCAASVTLQERMPRPPETEEQAEGTAAHLVAMWAAQGRLLAIGERFQSNDREWVVDVDMHNGARKYAEALGGLHSTLRLEDSVKISAIHPTDCWGTPDAWRYFPEGTGPNKIPVLRVGDFKWGHRFVEVFENWQLLAYAWGILERLNLDDSAVLFEFILVQPRSYHRDGPVRIWRVPAIETRGLRNIAFNKAHEALGPSPVATTGTHCLDCTARHLCVVFKQVNQNILDYSGAAELMPLDVEAMGQELRIVDAALKRLEARRTGLAVAVESTIRAGKRVPFYELGPGRSNLKWKPGVTAQEIADFGDLIGIQLRKPLEVFTPTQCVDAGVDEAAIKQDYAERPPAPLKLQAVDPTKVDKALAGVSTK